MKRTLLMTLLAAATLAPAAVLAQPPGYNSPNEGYYGQPGYYDHTGTWHANQPNPYPDGYFDRDGNFHYYANGNQAGGGGYYDRNGNWVPSSAGGGNGGYYDRNGNWIPATGSQTGGYYDRNGNWIPATGSQTGGYYDRNGNWVPNTAVPRGTYGNNGNGANGNGYYDRNGVWHPYGSTYGNSGYGAIAPQRWDYSERGHVAESLDVAARNFAQAAYTVARNTSRHSRYADNATLSSLQRLDQAAASFAQVANRRARPEDVGNAYMSVVNAFVDVQRTFPALQPDSWLSNQYHVMAANLGRVDKRYFGGRAFRGEDPTYLRGNSQYYPNGGSPYGGRARDTRGSYPY